MTKLVLTLLLFVGIGWSQMYCSTLASDPQQVTEDGVVLLEVSTQALVVNGTFWYDTPNTRVCVQTFDASVPSGHVMEAAARSYAATMSAQEYVTFQGLTLTGAQHAGLYATGNFTGTTVTGVTANTNHADGIELFYPVADAVQNVLVTNTTASYNGGSGIWLLSQAFGAGIVLSGNTTNYNSQIQTGTGDYQFVAGTYVNCSGGSSPGNTSTITVTNTVSAYNNPAGVFPDTDSVGAGIWSDTCANVTASHNSTAHNWGAGILLENNNNSKAIYNVSNGDAVNNSTGADDHAMALWMVADGGTASDGNQLLNNTIYGGTVGLGVQAQGAGASITNATVENNISYSNTFYQFYADGRSSGTLGVGNVFEYQNLGADSSAALSYYNGSAYSTYATLQTALGYTTHDVAGDPLFTNPGAGDFTLQAGSPAIGAGVYIAVVSTKNPPDLGAFQFVGGSVIISGKVMVGGKVF